MKEDLTPLENGAESSLDGSEPCLTIRRNRMSFWVAEICLVALSSCLIGALTAFLLDGWKFVHLYIGVYAVSGLIRSLWEFAESPTYVFYPRSIQVISRQIGNAGVRQYNRVQFENLTFLQNAIEKRMDVGRISFAVERVKHSRFFGDEDIVVLEDVSDFSEVREFLKTHATPLQDEP